MSEVTPIDRYRRVMVRLTPEGERIRCEVAKLHWRGVSLLDIATILSISQPVVAALADLKRVVSNNDGGDGGEAA